MKKGGRGDSHLEHTYDQPPAVVIHLVVVGLQAPPPSDMPSLGEGLHHMEDGICAHFEGTGDSMTRLGDRRQACLTAAGCAAVAAAVAAGGMGGDGVGSGIGGRGERRGGGRRGGGD
eukprot:CAMPEP_0174721444 /NCGR_PEP_ID=MMETSP1094-20130205/36211_1 /TAXON_ID=156173 /ORGANISM="Chrysochromulina brevifilum, Strain UTEX LB 985" /LENGTH=116 /DNA_ID=CAMNT_0015922141 /DNA_START=546 /DNA_END=893 /DNA_ORIENTATION=+